MADAGADGDPIGTQAEQDLIETQPEHKVQKRGESEVLVTASKSSPVDTDRVRHLFARQRSRRTLSRGTSIF